MPQQNAIEYFRIFYETSQAVLSSSCLQDILDLLVRRTVDALDVKGGSLRLVDERTHNLNLVASHHLSAGYLNKGPLSADLSVPEVLQGKVVLIKDAFDDPRIQYRKEMREEGVNTMLSVPVVARDKVIGVLRLYAARPRDFSDEQIEFASALAEIGGLAIANARISEAEGIKLSSLLKEVGVDLSTRSQGTDEGFKAFALQPVDPARSLEFFRILHGLTRAILSTMSLREVKDQIADQVLAIMKVKGCAIRLINETTRELDLVASRGLSRRFLQKGPLHADKSIRGALVGSPVHVPDARTDPRIEYPEEMVREGIVSILSLPIVARERVIGILRLYSGEPRSYSQDEVAFLSALAEIAGVAIMNARLYEKTRNDLSFWTATLDYLEAGHPKS